VEQPPPSPTFPWRALRIALAGIALIIGAVALWGPRIGIGSPNGIGLTRWTALLFAIALIGAAWAGSRIAAAYTTTAVLLLNTILVIVAMELGSAVVLFVLERPQPELARIQERPDPAEASPYYSGRPWKAEYWREFGQAASHYKYHPYYLWRMAPFEGSLIRVDSAGLRKTPDADCETGAFRLWFFGGSTAWGLGAPDDGTIPAYLEGLLREAIQKPVCVVNFGQLGFVSTQDLIQLELELQAGRRPDVAVFYGGVNDIVTAFQYNRAGVHWNLPSIAQKLEARPEPHAGAAGALPLHDLVALSNAYRLAKWLSRPDTGDARAPAYRYEGYFESDTLADAVVSAYLENRRIATALGTAYGFKVEFVWQPNVLVGAKPLTAAERAARDREPIAALTRKVYQRLRNVAPQIANLHDLTDVFAHDTGLVYLDWHHLTPEGNDSIAHAILRATPAISGGEANRAAAQRERR